jgi:hypothetical protein
VVAEDLRALSLDWEKMTGFDSIATIERVYARSPGGAYECVWPKCRFARRDAVAMWRHVHTSHGLNSLPPEMRSD